MGILDRSFRYVPASKTTPERLARVFAAERKRLAELAEQEKVAAAEVAVKVRKIGKGQT